MTGSPTAAATGGGRTCWAGLPGNPGKPGGPLGPGKPRPPVLVQLIGWREALFRHTPGWPGGPGTERPGLPGNPYTSTQYQYTDIN